MVFKTEKEKLSFREIALGHMKKILELSTIEYRGGYNKLVIKGEHSWKEYVPSTTKCQIQAIESFSDILEPHFDKKMKERNKKILEDIKKIKEKVVEEKQERIQEEYDVEATRYKSDPKRYHEPDTLEFQERLDKAVEIGSQEDSRMHRRKLRIMRILFRELNLLLCRVDYLKSAIYEEEEDDQ